MTLLALLYFYELIAEPAGEKEAGRILTRKRIKCSER